MVINRREIKRKRKENSSSCSLLDDGPKRTKVHAQRKFAQGSNISSPVITPVKEIEKQEKLRPDVLPEPQELLPMNRPNTDDFLTFLCFRGTSMLPPSLNFFNAAPVDSREHTQPLNHEPIDVCPPLANISAKATAGTSERPFIAFGVRKRADPILVSKHMDKKRRHALALQALRRKYQEQKMAKIRAVTISKLSEKTTTKNLVRTRSVTKHETTTKKSLTQKTRVKIVATKHVRVTTRSSIKTPIRSTISSPIRTQIQKKMCLRSFRGRFVQRELTITKPTKKKPTKIVKKSVGTKTDTKKKKETSSEFSSDDDQPLVKTVKVVKPSHKVPLLKVAKKCAAGLKKPMEIRVTRASHPLLSSTREQTVKRKIQISRTLPSKSPFVKLTPPKNHSPKQKLKQDKLKTRSQKTEKAERQEEKVLSPKAQKLLEEKLKKDETKKKLEISTEKDVKTKTVEKVTVEKELRKKSDITIEKDTKKKPVKSEAATEKELKKKHENLETSTKDSKKNTDQPEKGLKRKSDKLELERKKPDKLESTAEKDSKKKPEATTEKDSKKKPEATTEKDSKKKTEAPTEKDSKKKPGKPEVSLEKDSKKKPNKPDATTEKDSKKKPDKPEATAEKDSKKKPGKPEPAREKKKITKPDITIEKDTKKKPNKLETEKKNADNVEDEAGTDLKQNSSKHETAENKTLDEPEVSEKRKLVQVEVAEKKMSDKSDESSEKKKPDVSGEKKKPDKSEASTDKTKPEIAAAKPEIAAGKPQISGGKPEISAAKPEISAEKQKPDKPEILAEKDTKKKNIKSEIIYTEKESKKKANKVEAPEEPRVSQRPSRKTKEAAAIYMEILGHKLGNDGDIDDDSNSIDSFPELPNVRKTEQREIELKARVKSKNIEGSSDVTTKPTTTEDKNTAKNKTKTLDVLDNIANEPEESANVKKPKIEGKKCSKETEKDSNLVEKSQKKETAKNKKSDFFSDSDSSIKKNSFKKTENLTKIFSDSDSSIKKNSLKKLENLTKMFSDSDSSIKKNILKKTENLLKIDPTKKSIAEIFKRATRGSLQYNKPLLNYEASSDSEEFMEVKNIPNKEKTEKETNLAEKSQKKETPKIKNKSDLFSDSDSSFKKNNKNLTKIDPTKKSIAEIIKRATRGSVLYNKPLLDISSSDSEEFIGNENFPNKEKFSVLPKSIQTKPESKKTKICVKTRSQMNEESDSESDESTTSKTSQKKIKNTKNKKLAKATTTTKLDNSFSDSDEEPLSKLTQVKLKHNENPDTTINLEKNPAVNITEQKSDKKPAKNVLKRKSLERDVKETASNKKEPIVKQTKKDTKTEKKKLEDDQSSLILSGKPKRECTKRPQNYLPLFSSSEDEDKFFHGFVKNENPKPTKTTKVQETKCHPTPSADLLCKDVDKRFGKGKVNMSTEQIEKWLKDSAMAGSAIKKENFEIMKFDEKNPMEAMLLNLPTKIEEDIEKIPPKIEVEKSEKVEIKAELVSKPIITKNEPLIISSDKQLQNSQLMSKPTEVRKTIFKKQRKLPIPNINAFSASNESSVYAFEADNEDAISTPFRRPTRRPSSTATSRSEDSSKYEETSKGKFRIPPVVKPEPPKNTNKQEVSLMLSTDESNNSTSIAVQLDIQDSTDVFPESINPESSTQVNAEDSEQLFYIPLQPGKQSSSQLIQGVAVKLGTKGANGPNQRVVMSAKLVTHTPAGAQKLMEKPLATSTPMYPPSTTIQKSKNVEGSSKSFLKGGKTCDRTSENSEEFKYKIPSSPSASSSSSTKVTKRPHMKTRIRPLEFCNPVNASEFPSSHSPAVLLEAPVFHPNDKEFQDPLEYIEKIRPRAEKFGICRIVPPSNFKPECKVADDMRFTAYNQYVHKMLHRWGPNFKELMAISKYLKTQNIALTHPPWIGGMEIDLPRLYQIVQSLGGLKEVIEKKRWPKVSELMKIPKSAQDRVTKLDDIYCKYLLPYDTLSPAEREKLFDEVETEWAKRESRTLLRSQQNISSRDTSPNSSESDSGDEAEECIVKGRNMALNAFYRIARNTMSMYFKTMEPSAQEVEQEFWKHVTVKQNHICVHSGSIDSGNWGYGFAVSKNSPFARHAWNLKVLTNNSGSVLRSIGPLMGVTVPTLHVGMVFSACCWYRDPHRLPWIEYLHTGGNKIWYGIPDSMSEVFRSSLIKLVPNYCRNKSLWLPSDTAMVPPSLLVENGVSLCRTIQQPGQFIVVFPKAFTSSLCTGYVVSESVYFAPLSWLNNAQTVFDELHNSCEPSMFSLEKLLISIASDVRSNVDVLKQIIPAIELLSEKENLQWKKLEEMGLTDKERLPLPEAPIKKRKRLQNDSGDYECEICCKNLFVSWVTESQDGIYCLDHAIEYIDKKKVDVQNCKLIFTYDDAERKSLIEKIKSTIEMKLQKKTAGKGAGLSA